MELQHVNVKIYADNGQEVELAPFIDIFHKWVSEQVFDELLVDVADYRHVPAGPGVLLVGLEGDYGMDNTDDRLGMRYNRKAPLAGSNQERFAQAFKSAAKACQMLEAEYSTNGGLKFSRQEFEVLINDRAFAPNTAETFAACKPDLEAFLKDQLGHEDFTLTHRDNPRSRFAVIVSAAKPFDLS